MQGKPLKKDLYLNIYVMAWELTTLQAKTQKQKVATRAGRVRVRVRVMWSPEHAKFTWRLCLVARCPQTFADVCGAVEVFFGHYPEVPDIRCTGVE